MPAQPTNPRESIVAVIGDDIGKARSLLKRAVRSSARRLRGAGAALLSPSGANRPSTRSLGSPAGGHADDASAVAASTAADDLVRQYLANGRVAWSPGYKPYRNAELHRAVHDESLLTGFREAQPLPAGYGLGLDERLVEYPWVLARLPLGAGRLLDAGSTLNYPYLLDLPQVARKQVVIVTLAPEHVESRRNVSYLYDDLRDLVLRDDAFDTIVCISTLEHIGLDNTQLYTADARYAEGDRDGYKPALQELNRVLATGGRLLLTVPFGRAENHGWLQQFDAAGIERIVAAFGHAPAETTYFRYDASGWQVSNAAACGDRSYYDIHAGGPPPEDGAAAARAVACLMFTKP